jgi:hypothetical protein
VTDEASQPTDEAYTAAAWLLMCEPRALRAIAVVEAGRGGAFLPTGEPVILFERHVFHRLTAGKFDSVAPDLSAPTEAAGYGTFKAQHARLADAVKLDRIAALKSASWGLFQIMGENHAQAGYPDIQRFVNAMYRSVDDHLRALVVFIRNDDRLVDAIRAKDWTAFARTYNGPAFANSRYDKRIAEAYSAGRLA